MPSTATRKPRRGSNLTLLFRTELDGREYLFGKGRSMREGWPDFLCITECGSRGRIITVPETALVEFANQLARAIKDYGPVTSVSGICPGCRDLSLRQQYSDMYGSPLPLHRPKLDGGGFCVVCTFHVRQSTQDNTAQCPGPSDQTWISKFDDPTDPLLQPHPFQAHSDAKGGAATSCGTCTYDLAKQSEYQAEATAASAGASPAGSRASRRKARKSVKSSKKSLKRSKASRSSPRRRSTRR